MQATSAVWVANTGEKLRQYTKSTELVDIAVTFEGPELLFLSADP
jgi:hypothetical protein